VWQFDIITLPLLSRTSLYLLKGYTDHPSGVRGRICLKWRGIVQLTWTFCFSFASEGLSPLPLCLWLSVASLFFVLHLVFFFLLATAITIDFDFNAKACGNRVSKASKCKAPAYGSHRSSSFKLANKAVWLSPLFLSIVPDRNIHGLSLFCSLYQRLYPFLLLLSQARGHDRLSFELIAKLARASSTRNCHGQGAKTRALIAMVTRALMFTVTVAWMLELLKAMAIVASSS